jgi:hypothetical protein
MSDQPPKRPQPEHLKALGFQPGKSGNPAGRPPLDPEVRALKKLNRVAFELLVDELSYLNYEELKALAATAKPKDGKVQCKEPTIKIALARLLEQSIAKGDYKGLQMLLDQKIGKATVKIEASGPQGTPLFTSVRDRSERKSTIREIQAALAKMDRAETIGNTDDLQPTDQGPTRDP